MSILYAYIPPRIGLADHPSLFRLSPELTSPNNIWGPSGDPIVTLKFYVAL